MTLAILALITGIVALVWSADRFVDGSAATARHLGMSPLLIGMVIVGFGTSAPELLVSSMAAAQNNPGLALGNAYGSNITNIALILGVTALINPILVHSSVLRRELPVLTGVTALAAFQLRDGQLNRFDGLVLLAFFAGLLVWTVRQSRQSRRDHLGGEMARELATHPLPFRRALLWVGLGLAGLIVSSRALVWGAVQIAHALGVSDLLIGLTIVAVGTSLPELASSIAAIRKNEHDIALGNILGSNLFNTLMVVGVAALVHPLTAPPEVFARDLPVMGALTVALFAIGYDSRGQGRISRAKGALLLAAYLGYTALLALTALAE
jgi:cation:H+ antiporter